MLGKLRANTSQLGARRKGCIGQLSLRGCFKTSAVELQECGATSESDKSGREPVFRWRNEPSPLLTAEVCFMSMLLLSSSCV